MAQQEPAKQLALIRTSTTPALQIATATASVVRLTEDRASVEIQLIVLAAQLAPSAWQILTAQQVVAAARIMCANRRKFVQISAKLEKNVAVGLTVCPDAATKGCAMRRKRAIKNSNFGKSWSTLWPFRSLSCSSSYLRPFSASKRLDIIAERPKSNNCRPLLHSHKTEQLQPNINPKSFLKKEDVY